VTIAEDIVTVAQEHESGCRYKIFSDGSSFAAGGMTISDRAVLVIGGLKGFSASSVAVFTNSQQGARIVTRSTRN
jgi:hypothetical protein